jgi:hypothetical protein
MMRTPQILKRDAEEVVRWARDIHDSEAQSNTEQLFHVLLDRQQIAARRVRAAFGLNAIGSSHKLAEGVGRAGKERPADMSSESDLEIRRPP